RRVLVSTLFPYTTLFRSCESAGWFRRRGADRRLSRCAVPAFLRRRRPGPGGEPTSSAVRGRRRQLHSAAAAAGVIRPPAAPQPRSEEHTSELQSRFDLVC